MHPMRRSRRVRWSARRGRRCARLVGGGGGADGDSGTSGRGRGGCIRCGGRVGCGGVLDEEDDAPDWSVEVVVLTVTAVRVEEEEADASDAEVASGAVECSTRKTMRQIGRWRWWC